MVRDPKTMVMGRLLAVASGIVLGSWLAAQGVPRAWRSATSTQVLTADVDQSPIAAQGDATTNDVIEIDADTPDEHRHARLPRTSRAARLTR